MKISKHAPVSPTGPGTSPQNPFVVSSIPGCYAILRTLHMKVGDGMIKVRFERIGGLSVAGFENPVDHYVLHEGDLMSEDSKGKLMDFYMYGWGERTMPMKSLPAGLGDMMVTGDADLRKSFDRIAERLEQNPEFMAKMEELRLQHINLARIQKGLPPLKSLKDKGSCMITLAAISGAITVVVFLVSSF